MQHRLGAAHGLRLLGHRVGVALSQFIRKPREGLRLLGMLSARTATAVLAFAVAIVAERLRLLGESAIFMLRVAHTRLWGVARREGG